MFIKSGYKDPLTIREKRPCIDDLQIEEDGVAKLLEGLSLNKASGPDAIQNRMLKGLAKEVSPFITHLFNM